MDIYDVAEIICSENFLNLNTYFFIKDLLMTTEKVLDDFICPISHHIMLEPVSDGLGEVYEREEIESWFGECKKMKKVLTSPNTNEELDSDKLIPARKIKPKITQFLEKHPHYWSEVYISKKLIENFNQALKTKDKNKLAELIKQEPRFLTLNNCELIVWIFKENDLIFLKDIVISNLYLRGQKEKIFEVITLSAEKKCIEGMRMLITAEKWLETDYHFCVKKWIKANSPKLVKAILHEMQAKKFNLNAEDNLGNTLVHEAVLSGNDEIVYFLLATGLDGKTRNAEGLTPEDIAAKNNCNKVLEVFKNFYAAGQQTATINPQLKLLQNEIQELTYQLAEVKNELREQNKREMTQLFKGLSYSATPFFTSLKEQSFRKYFNKSLKTIKTNNVSDILVNLPNSYHVITRENESCTISFFDIKNDQYLHVIKNNDDSDNCAVTSFTILSNGLLAISSISLLSESVSTIKIWDIENETCLKTILADDGERFIGLENLPDGSLISKSVCLSNKDDRYSSFVGNFKIWDIENCKCIKKISWLEKDSINSRIKLSHCEQLVRFDDYMITYFQKTLQVWDIKSEQCVKLLEGHTDKINWIKITPDGYILSASYDTTLKVWDFKSGKCLQTLVGHAQRIAGIANLADGNVITCSDDSTIKVWNIKTGECLQTLTEHTDKVYDIAILPDGSLCSVSNDCTMKVYEMNPVLKDVYHAQKSIKNEVPECKMM
jgi:WD40 repeat protein